MVPIKITKVYTTDTGGRIVEGKVTETKYKGWTLKYWHLGKVSVSVGVKLHWAELVGKVGGDCGWSGTGTGVHSAVTLQNKLRRYKNPELLKGLKKPPKTLKEENKDLKVRVKALLTENEWFKMRLDATLKEKTQEKATSQALRKDNMRLLREKRELYAKYIRAVVYQQLWERFLAKIKGWIEKWRR